LPSSSRFLLASEAIFSNTVWREFLRAGHLLDASDVVVTNMRPDALARLGLDAESVRARRPDIVHCTLTGFGPGGPYRGRPAYDSVVQGASGIAGLFAERDEAPSYVPLMMADHVVGEIAAGAILAALCRRLQSGQGSAIEVPMFETMAAMVLQEHLGPETFVPALDEVGDRRILSAHNRPMRTANGWISVTANTDAQARGMLKAIGRDDLLDDPRFATASARFRNIDDWFSIRTEALATETTEKWLQPLNSFDVPCMPCHSLKSLLDDPHLSAVQLIEPVVKHTSEGFIRNLRSTVLQDARPLPTDHLAEAGAVGRDTEAVLRELSFSAEEILDLLACSAAATEVR
jgi:crotonobetainyl-CoA:carnitine CoA-transferase CaiB-like acyl-CoA transferase